MQTTQMQHQHDAVGAQEVFVWFNSIRELNEPWDMLVWVLDSYK